MPSAVRARECLVLRAFQETEEWSSAADRPPIPRRHSSGSPAWVVAGWSCPRDLQAPAVHTLCRTMAESTWVAALMHSDDRFPCGRSILCRSCCPFRRVEGSEALRPRSPATAKLSSEWPVWRTARIEPDGGFVSGGRGASRNSLKAVPARQVMRIHPGCCCRPMVLRLRWRWERSARFTAGRLTPALSRLNLSQRAMISAIRETGRLP